MQGNAPFPLLTLNATTEGLSSGKPPPYDAALTPEAAVPGWKAAGVSDSKQLPTASRAHRSAQSKPPKQKISKNIQWVDFPRVPASLGAVLGLPSDLGGAAVGPASVFNRGKWLELIFSFAFTLRSKNQICSSAFTSGIQANHCVPFRWINLPAPSTALQFPLCLSYVVFLIMPQELFPLPLLFEHSHWTAGHKRTKAKSCAGAGGLFPDVGSRISCQHAPRPPSPKLISMACSFLLHFQKPMPNEPSKLTGKFWIHFAATKCFLVTMLYRENNYFWKVFSYSMEY